MTPRPRTWIRWLATAARGGEPSTAERTHRRVRELQNQVGRLERRIDALQLQEQVRRLERRIDALTRAQILTGIELPPPYELTSRRFRAYSQNDEDGLTLEIVRRAGVGPGRFVDIGCGIKGGNSRFFAEELGWSGLMIDARPEIAKLEGRFPPGRVRAHSGWVTRGNVDDLLREHGLNGEIDLLSIDVDGMDYWLWEAVTAASPRLVICEYNSYFGPDAAVTVPYRDDFDRKQRDTRYYGASLAALVELSRRKGYRLVAVEPTGVNGFFLRDDLAPGLRGFEARELFRRQPRHEASIAKGRFDMAIFVPENDLPLIDVAAMDDDQPAHWRPGVAEPAARHPG